MQGGILKLLVVSLLFCFPKLQIIFNRLKYTPYAYLSRDIENVALKLRSMYIGCTSEQ